MAILDDSFLAEYRTRSVPMDALGAFTYTRTYSRDGETWTDTCARVIEGMYKLQELQHPKWDIDKARRSARDAFDMLYNLKWSPPGRGLWIMGTPFVHERGEVEALQNCAFISSKFITTERGDFFRWVMEMSMMGVGVGFDTEGAGKAIVYRPSITTITTPVPDTRQGWAEALQKLVDSYLVQGSPSVSFDYSNIRPAGEPIVGFGGVAAGAEPLARLLVRVAERLDQRVGGRLSSTDIVDICNMVGECVIAGNVRRSAEIALGRPDDKRFIDLKNYEVVGDTRPWSWVSNNSVLYRGHEGTHDLRTIVSRTYANGEPGYVWLDNIQNYGRMNGIKDNRDAEAVGVNPCAEQTLHHRELCTLSEIYLPHIGSKLELARAIKYAYLYAKSVTCASEGIRDPISRDVMSSNRRIGLSMTGVAQFLGNHSKSELIDWMEYAYQLSGYYDELYSEWLGVPTSIRRTSIKPSGTVSLLAGVTPGIHYPLDRTYIRRVRLASNSPLVDRVLSAGYRVEPDVTSQDTLVVSFPVDLGEVKTIKEVSLQDQLELAALAARHYADNSVSITAQFDRSKVSEEDLLEAVQFARSNLKAVSFLPYEDHGYEQAPYESITAESYGKMVAHVRPLDLSGVSSHEAYDAFCDGLSCEIPQ